MVVRRLAPTRHSLAQLAFMITPRYHKEVECFSHLRTRTLYHRIDDERNDKRKGVVVEIGWRVKERLC